MKNQEKIKIIAKFQKCNYVHSLTCGNDYGHRLLIAKVLKRRVYLVCPDCDYKQLLRNELFDCCHKLLQNVGKANVIEKLMQGRDLKKGKKND